MQTKKAVRLLSLQVLSLLLLLPSAAIADPVLSDRNAKSVIEQAWNSNSIWVKLGNLKIVRDEHIQLRNAKLKGDEISFSQYQIYKNWEQLEIIVTLDEKDFTKEFGSWPEFMKLSQEGIRGTVRIEVTQHAKDLGLREKTVGDTHWLLIPEGEYEVERIVRNEEVRKYTKVFRLIMGMHRAKASPLVAKYYKHIGLNRVDERKFAALLEYDFFLKIGN